MINEKCIVRSGSLRDIPDLFGRLWDTGVPLVVADRNTWDAAGAKVLALLIEHGKPMARSFIFPDIDEVYADDVHVDQLRRVLVDNDLIAVAVGSGTINDIAKRASFECSKEYLVVPTAPSVDGFTASGAAITAQGFKTTLACPPPTAVVADTDVLRGAPYSMLCSGFGDLAAKKTGGADWIVADQLGIEPIAPPVWEMVQQALDRCLSQTYEIAQRDPTAIEGLFSGLAQTGYAIQRYGDSRPASGSEHLLSHVWEMRHLQMKGHTPSHGFKVAVGTLVMTAFMTEMILLDRTEVAEAISARRPLAWHEHLQELERVLPEGSIRAPFVEAAKSKFLEGAPLQARQQDILDNWKSLQERIKAQLIPFDRLKGMFSQVGCPFEPSQIGLSKADLLQSIHLAQSIRKRYTSLDLAFECGLLDGLADKVGEPGAYFSSFSMV